MLYQSIRMCLGLALLGCLGSLGLAGESVFDGRAFAADWLLDLLPAAAAFLAVIGGVLCLLATRGQTASATALPSTQEVAEGLQQCARELGSLLVEERGRVTSLQEICSAGMRDARTLGTRVENLAEAAMDAETRLADGVLHAANAVQQMRSSLPDVPKLMREGIASSVSAHLAGDIEPLVQSLRSTMAQAADQMTRLSDTAAVLQRELTSMQAAGRDITVAGASVVSRLGAAVGQIDAVVSTLPSVVERIVVAAEARAMVAAAVDENAGVSIGLIEPSARTLAIEPAEVAGLSAAGNADVPTNSVNALTDESQTLLVETKALVDAAATSRLAQAPDLLADHAPDLLKGIEAVAQRLRSIAETLSLVGSGDAGASGDDDRIQAPRSTAQAS